MVSSNLLCHYFDANYPLAISRLLISFFTFHTAIFLSAIDSEDMIMPGIKDEARNKDAEVNGRRGKGDA